MHGEYRRCRVNNAIPEFQAETQEALVDALGVEDVAEDQESVFAALSVRDFVDHQTIATLWK